MLAAPAWRFVCCTEAVAEGKAPVEADGKKPEPADSGPVQAENGGDGVKEQAESANSAVKEEGPRSPPPPGKYSCLTNPIPLSACMFTPLALPITTETS